MAPSTSSQTSDPPATAASSQISIPPSLKLVLSSIKTIIPTALSNDNYPVWRSQILKLLRANGFANHLDSSKQRPNRLLQTCDGTPSLNPLYTQWILIYQNLAAALCSTISPSILPYVLHLECCSDIWSTLEQRLQASNRSRVMQLKNELHNVSMRNLTMTQYLTSIKTLVDNIAAAGSQVDSEDIILYIFNGLPTTYQAFKTSIRTKRIPVTLDELYSYLLTEEINLAAESHKEQ
ncbi:hypothetical protein KFK09_004486 [Dendrobium nobile]|uniref:Retrovirus-related Pol polyprotein from transposon TNT 1-94 n=1 Tax=Dendrobium nobile TaxID=94219 RepID=A0A8T3C0K5_DENNO|nr:hypothetical protein KFK09_004486 [Dendrobium nobile]